MMNDEKGTEMLNFITKQEYSGNNADILFAASEEFESPYFLTYRQAISIGKVVKKGERGYRLCRVVFVEDLKKKKKVAKPKYFTVFNIEQTEELKKEAA
jgi:antirestriction protein ArdC